MSKQTPNIVLIVLDTLRPDHLSCYGYAKPTSPNLDQVAKEGVLFQNAFCTAPWTLPSHGSIFTGAYVSRHGLDQGSEVLADDLVTMAELLARQGYATAAFSSNIWVSKMTGLSRGFSYFKRANVPPFDEVAEPNPLQKMVKEIYWRYFFKRYDYGAREINGMVKHYFSRVWNKERPFFMFINYLETHLKYEPPGKFRDLFLEDKAQKRLARHVNQDARKVNGGLLHMSEAEFEVLRALYDAEIRYVDYRLGEVLSLLKELNRLDDTLLILTSDHGENIGDHGLMDHQFSVHDTLVQVPLIIRFPKAFEPSSVAGQFVQTVDFLPTVADILNLSPNSLPQDQIQGQSILSLQRNGNQRAVFAEYLNPRVQVLERAFPDRDWSAFNRKLRSIRTDRHKLIAASDGAHELYDVENDPAEAENRIKEHPELAQQLLRRLDDWVASVEKKVAKTELEFQKDTLRVLEGLGYV
ncbi:MAG: sulfatase [bacterium]